MSSGENLGFLVLLELTLEDIDTEVDSFLEAVSNLFDEEFCSIDLKFDGGFLIISHFGLNYLEDDLCTMQIFGEAIELVKLLRDELLELGGGIEVDGLNTDVHS